MKNNKDRLFEIISRLDKTFTLKNNIDENIENQNNSNVNNVELESKVNDLLNLVNDLYKKNDLVSINKMYNTLFNKNIELPDNLKKLNLK